MFLNKLTIQMIDSITKILSMFQIMPVFQNEVLIQAWKVEH